MGGGGSNGGTVDVKAIRALKDGLIKTVGPDIDHIQQLPEKFGEIEISNWTQVTPALAAAYWVAVEFINKEIPSKKEHLEQIIGVRLEQCAANWEKCESDNTMPGGK